MTELLWLAAEQNNLTVEMVHEAFSGEDLTPVDLAGIRQTLEGAGVELAGAAAVEPEPTAAHTAAPESARVESQSAAVQNRAPLAEETQLLPRAAERALLNRMAEADLEMRQIFYRFGFAAHEHLARAEKLLAHPAQERFEVLVADSEIHHRSEYLQTLPGLVQQVRTLDHKAAAGYRKWRQTLGQPGGERRRSEFRKLDRKLRQTFPRFCYRPKVIQEMIAIAQGLAAKLQASQRVLLQAGRHHGTVFQMPLVDVERQTIERMEESVRLPGEVFLGNCAQLEAAAARFQQARGELIQHHLRLVASIAETCANRGLTLPELIREGIDGLIRAVETFGYRREGRFATYAAGWIRQSLRGAVAAQPRPASGPAPATAGNGGTSSAASAAGESAEEAQSVEAASARKAA